MWLVISKIEREKKGGRDISVPLSASQLRVCVCVQCQCYTMPMLRNEAQSIYESLAPVLLQGSFVLEPKYTLQARPNVYVELDPAHCWNHDLADA